MQKVIGLAGHIDHGKTALVKALTGIDTDRLEEEKRRGVTIDIGIAFYTDEVTFIDVPGHEKFIKNMVTGVSTVDAALLVIAADDGVMPQTREHLDILKILGVEKLVVALNKTDLVDEEWVEMVSADVQTFLSQRDFGETPIVPVSSTRGLGIDDLKQTLDDLIQTLEAKDQQGIFRLPIDRVFSVKGFGTVVTGTVLSHELHKAQTVELFPQEIVYPVRGLQSHHQDVDKIKPGDRGAINLGGASVDELGRGAFLGSPGMFQSGSAWLGRLSVLEHWKRPVKEAERVHIHVGTGKREARIHLLEGNSCQPGQDMWAQFFFDQPVSAGFHEKVVIRFLSPEETLGGADLLWMVEKRIKKGDSRLGHLHKLATSDVKTVIDAVFKFFQQPLSRKQIARRMSVAESKIHSILQDDTHYVAYLDNYLDIEAYHSAQEMIISALTAYHEQEPLGKGLQRDQVGIENEAIRDFVLNRSLAEDTIKNQGNLWQLAGHQSDLDEADQEIRAKIRDIFQTANYSSPSMDQVKQEVGTKGETIIQWMIQHRDLIRIDKDYYLLDNQLDNFISVLKQWFLEHDELTVGELRDIIPTTRKYLLPLLQHAERKGYLLRVGDVRRWAGEELS
ncbi:MAG: selenocysteine-specific translation elongation factor [Candidatus Marinimicrobia bacterium]|nr:selenocysteine-specific translation elongation factor [Candidatus Neomarinimicrobiota bacterium]MCF7851187.1 selenocysteine-specific translation elongation factor [Candidatus Neomarinimicrobiota bacterium]MCF7904230.1 selenocysteine-specific translation elongation factor [Candidatus Neomarinimicrobiota bacterium]